MLQTYTPKTIKEINPNRDSYTLNYSSPLNPTILPNNKNSCTLLNPTFNPQNYEQRNFIDGGLIALLFLIAIGVGVAAAYAHNYTLPPEAQRILGENKREEEKNTSGLESNLNCKITERDKETLTGVLVASLMYNSNKSTREKTKNRDENRDYSIEEYLKGLEAELREEGIKVNEGTEEEVYEGRRSEAETEEVNKNPENLESRAEPTEESADVTPQGKEFAPETEVVESDSE